MKTFRPRTACALIVVCMAVTLLSGYSLTYGATPATCYTEIDPVYLQTHPSTVLHIKHDADVAPARTAVIDFLFSGEGLPTDGPATVVTDITTPYLAGNMENLAGIDAYTFVQPQGFASTAYHLRPVTGNNRLLIVHQGHHHDLNGGEIRDTIEFFLSHGYAVLALQMPMLGPNTGPVLESPETLHDKLATLESPTFNPLSLFVEPVVRSINYIEEEYDYDNISMTGLSGGGWTTDIAAAIDTRIQKSFPVAGSLPLHLRLPPCGLSDVGDYEQGMSVTGSGLPHELYTSVASYLDLYALGAYGNNRKRIQILNQFDSCCFHGVRYETYEDTLNQLLGKLHHEIFLDTTHTSHKISAAARNRILQELENTYPEEIPPASPPLIIDNTDAGFTSTGSWVHFVNQGYQDSVRFSASGSGLDSAKWTIALPPGNYKIATTWSPYTNRATNAPYRINGAPPTLLNQKLAPDDFQDAGVGWETLGIITVAHELTIELTDAANGYVIADAIRIERTNESPTPIILDNTDAGFTSTGSWVHFVNQGLKNSVHFSASGSGLDAATWTIALPPGNYKIATTWSPYMNRATNAPYSINGATPVLMNQELTPDDFQDAGVGWENLGTVTVTNQLTVRLTDAANEFVIADAIRIEKVGN